MIRHHHRVAAELLRTSTDAQQLRADIAEARATGAGGITVTLDRASALADHLDALEKLGREFHGLLIQLPAAS